MPYGVLRATPARGGWRFAVTFPSYSPQAVITIPAIPGRVFGRFEDQDLCVSIEPSTPGKGRAVHNLCRRHDTRAALLEQDSVLEVGASRAVLGAVGIAIGRENDCGLSGSSDGLEREHHALFE